MNATQQQLPIIVAGKIHWLEGVECQFGQFAAVLAKAEAAGFHATHMNCIRGGYSLRFARPPAPEVKASRSRSKLRLRQRRPMPAPVAEGPAPGSKGFLFQGGQNAGKASPRGKPDMKQISIFS